MSKRIYMWIAALFLCCLSAQGQHWQCNIYDYQYDMTVYATLQIEGTDITASDDYELAAFCGDECRGVATVEEKDSSAYYYLRVRSNSQNGETITFKVYDKILGKEVDASWLQTTLIFEADDRKGYPSSPYVITFKAPIVYHTVTVLESPNGTVIGGGKIESGKEITLTAVPNEGYEFVNWTDGATANPYTFQVTTDKEIGANFIPKKYKISYVIDGVTVLTDSVAYTSVIEPLDAPEKEGHTFAGWQNVPETMPANDIEIIGSYTVNVYAINYFVDGEEYHTDSIAYGDTIILIAEPVKEGYIFSGWSEVPETMPAKDVRVDGSFETIDGLGTVKIDANSIVTVYSTNGTLIKKNKIYQDVLRDLPKGVYIINGKKIYIRQ